MKKLGSIKNGSKNTYPFVSTRPRTMTFADYQLLTEEQKQGEIIIKDYPVPEEGDYVEVVGDGVKTYQTLLKELYDEIDSDKVTNNAKLFVGNNLFSISRNIDGDYRFGECETSGNGTAIQGKAISLNATLSRNHMVVASTKSGSTTFTNYDSTISTDGEKITLYYNKTKTLELGTLAENCMMSDGSNVQNLLTKRKPTITPASGVEITNNLVEFNGVLIGKIRVHRSTNFTPNAWTTVGTIDRVYSTTDYVRAIAEDPTSGGFNGLIAIIPNSNEIKVFPATSSYESECTFVFPFE